MKIRSALIALAASVAAIGVALSAPFGSHGGTQSILDPNASYPEGPLFVGGKLYVGEMGADRVSVYENGAKKTFFHERGCGPTALAPYRGGFAILCHLGGEIIAVDAKGQITARYGKGLLRDPNDGYADGKGGLYFSDPGPFAKDAVPSGLIYRLTAAGELQRVAEGLWYPNGVFAEGVHVFVSETFRRKVWRYTIGADGALTQKQLFFDVAKSAPKAKRYYREAGPDGLERAPNGEMIVAIYGEGRLLRINRGGVLAGVIDVPFPYVDNVAFGSPGGVPSAVLVGAYDNVNPPLRGEVRWWKP